MASGEKSLSHNMFATSITDAKLAYTSPQPLEYSLGAKYPMKCRFQVKAVVPESLDKQITKKEEEDELRIELFVQESNGPHFYKVRVD